MLRQPRREDYTVGWVCALPVELAAATAMLDEQYNVTRNIDDNDGNIYRTGLLAGHNVVIVCLPAGCTGNNSTVAVAMQMRAFFKGIRFVLMVGIGGGVPSREVDIRLGDVVVSQPSQTFGGVVQYDMGKTTASGFERTGSLNSPPQILLSAVSTMKTNKILGKSTLLHHLSNLEGIPDFYPSRTGPDVLFEATYNHEGGSTCAKCDIDRQQIRLQRKGKVMVHYGTIASGNQVMKTAVERNRVSAQHGGVLCFEMEAAGLMNNFPCLVIRGICDYADSHKNKRWQAYAAGTAAAYAKELLSIIPVTEVVEQTAMRDAIDVPTGINDPEQVGLESRLADLQRARGTELKWQQSVVDLLKLLRLSSNPRFRHWLATRLQVRAGPTGSEEQNNALHRAVMQDLVAGELKWQALKECRFQQGRCLNCGDHRHWEVECVLKCGKCLNNDGHKASGCKYPIRCFRCRRIGHMAGDC